MKALNFNHDSFTMFDSSNDMNTKDTESQSFQSVDIVSTLEDISCTNISDALCDLSDREYTH